MKTKYIITFILVGLIVTMCTGCSLLRKRVEKTEKIEYKLNGKGKYRLDIDNSNGSVEVEPADDTLGLIYITAIMTGEVRESDMNKPLDGIEVKIDTTDEIIKIETDIKRTFGFFKKHSGGKVNYKIKIPKNLKFFAETVNGTLRAENLNTDIRLEAVNGSLVVNKCYGMVDLSTVNGSIKGNFDSTKGIVAETVNGNISFGGLNNASVNVDISVVNGRIKHSNLNFTGLTSEKRSLSGILGKGEAPIRISAVNGSIALNGNYISVHKTGNDDFKFKIDFDDDGDLDIYELKHDDDGDDNRVNTKTDTAKTQELKKDTSKVIPDKKADSLKNK